MTLLKIEPKVEYFPKFFDIQNIEYLKKRHGEMAIDKQRQMSLIMPSLRNRKNEGKSIGKTMGTCQAFWRKDVDFNKTSHREIQREVKLSNFSKFQAEDIIQDMIKKDVVTVKDRIKTKKLNSERRVVYTEEWIEAQKRPMSRFSKKRNISRRIASLIELDPNMPSNNVTDVNNGPQLDNISYFSKVEFFEKVRNKEIQRIQDLYVKERRVSLDDVEQWYLHCLLMFGNRKTNSIFQSFFGYCHHTNSSFRKTISIDFIIDCKSRLKQFARKYRLQPIS